MKKQRFLYQLANSVIRTLAASVVFVLFLHSIFSTSFVGRAVREDGGTYGRTMNIPDSPWKHLLVFVLVSLLCAVIGRICRRRQEGQGSGMVWLKHGRAGTVSAGQENHGGTGGRMEMEYGKGTSLYWLSLVLFGMGILWIALTQMRPGSDPAKVYAIALEWRAGDFSAFEEGNYLFCYPFQAGIVLFYYLLTFLYGTKSYIGPQVVNAAALAVIYLLLSLMARSFWKKERRLPVLVYVALMCWTPLFFFVTYVYGILPGMACSLGMVYLAVRYVETREYWYMVPAALCIGIATVLKMNCLIYLVAATCFMVYDMADTLLQNKENRDKWKKCISSAAFVALMWFSVWGCGRLSQAWVEHLSGYDMPEGEVMISWVVMGLQEAPKGPGDYNGYNGDVFARNNYDTKLATEQSFTDLRKIIKRMTENPLDEGVTFFARKTAYQWNDPTFISMERMRGRKSAVEIAAPVRSLIEGKGSVALSVWLNYVQTLVWSGILLYLFLNWNSRNLYELMGIVIFLGGYLFHMVWEASASYTIPYFAVIIPYAVKGFYDWAKTLGVAGGKRTAELRLDKKAAVCAVGVAAVLVLTFCFTRTNLFHRTIALNDGAEAVGQYYHQND